MIATTLAYISASLAKIGIIGAASAYAISLPVSSMDKIARYIPPIEVKGVYATAYTAGAEQLRDRLIQLIDRTELNSIVIDIKDASGRIFFDTSIELADEIGAEEIRIPDLKELIDQLHEKNIYVIARIVVMQDPHLAKSRGDLALIGTTGALWRDWRGQAWVDPTREEVWQYNIDLAKEAITLGFDEINFDYIRFPSDGPVTEIPYTKQEKNEVMKQFYDFLGKELLYQPAFTSADLFGMTLWRDDGMNIGQRFADAAPNFDFIMPMVYPSHYPDGFEGFANPAEHPYEIIYKSLIRAEKIDGYDPTRHARIRPWLQDFDLGAVYTPELINAQKQATVDSGGIGWILWNAANRYTEGGLATSNN